VLEGVISQRLVKRVNGKRTAVVEVMRRTPRVVDLIVQNRDFELFRYYRGG